MSCTEGRVGGLRSGVLKGGSVIIVVLKGGRVDKSYVEGGRLQNDPLKGGWMGFEVLS